MKVTKVSTRQLLAFEDLEVKLGSGLTIAKGPNECGKTSIVEIIKAFFTGGKDVTIVRKGAESGEVAVEFDDGYRGRRVYDADGSNKVEIFDPAGKKLPGSGAKFLSALADALSLNPLAFFHAPPKQRVSWFIETVPVNVSAEEITKATGFPYRQTGEERNGFDLLYRLRKAFYDERTGINGQITAKKKTCEELTRTLPEVDPESIGGLAELRQRQQELESGRQSERARIAGEKSAAEVALDKKFRAKMESIKADRAEADRKASAIVDEARRAARELQDAAALEQEKATAALNARLAEFTEKLNAKALADRSAADEQFSGQLAELAAAIAKAEVAESSIAVTRNTRQTIEKYKREIVELSTHADQQSAAIDGIDSLKEQLITRVGIPGLEIRDGDIWINGVAFDRLNEETKIKICFQLARMRAGDCPLVCADGFEALDSRHRELFEQFVEESGLQAFVTIVADTEPCPSCKGQDPQRLSCATCQERGTVPLEGLKFETINTKTEGD